MENGEFVILQEVTLSEVQKKLNQWRHQYCLKLGELSQIAGLYVMVVERTKR